MIGNGCGAFAAACGDGQKPRHLALDLVQFGEKGGDGSGGGGDVDRTLDIRRGIEEKGLEWEEWEGWELVSDAK